VIAAMAVLIAIACFVIANIWDTNEFDPSKSVILPNPTI
jgi:hypothetical protein